jgi:hypothetical protein
VTPAVQGYPCPVASLPESSGGSAPSVCVPRWALSYFAPRVLRLRPAASLPRPAVRAARARYPPFGGELLSIKLLKLFRKLSRARQRCFRQRAIILLIDDRQQRAVCIAWSSSHEDHRIRPHCPVGSRWDSRIGKRTRCQKVLGRAPDQRRALISLFGPPYPVDPRRRTPMRLVVIISAVALGLVAGAVASAYADRWPADLWERLDREPS